MLTLFHRLKLVTTVCFVYWEHKFLKKEFDQCKVGCMPAWPVLQDQSRKQALHVTCCQQLAV